jgi:hypothetical protein
MYNVAGYFDERPMLNLHLGWGDLFIHLPFKTGILECDPPRWGVYWYDSSLWFVFGNAPKEHSSQITSRMYYLDAPWKFEWYRTSIFLKNGTWETESRGNRKEFWHDKWDYLVYEEQHPYTYVLNNGNVQKVLARVRIKEMEWRRKWLPFTQLFNRVRRSIDVQFSDEVGERAGTWKGGCYGCGYDMLPGETAEQTLRRMEKERKF